MEYAYYLNIDQWEHALFPPLSKTPLSPQRKRNIDYSKIEGCDALVTPRGKVVMKVEKRQVSRLRSRCGAIVGIGSKDVGEGGFLVDFPGKHGRTTKG